MRYLIIVDVDYNEHPDHSFSFVSSVLDLVLVFDRVLIIGQGNRILSSIVSKEVRENVLYKDTNLKHIPYEKSSDDTLNYLEDMSVDDVFVCGCFYDLAVADISVSASSYFNSYVIEDVSREYFEKGSPDYLRAVKDMARAGVNFVNKVDTL